MTRKGLTSVTALAAASVLMFAMGTVQAASACKGLDKAACGKKADCSWVEGYTKKDGAKVSGYCRTKSGGSNKTSAETKKAK